MALVLTTLLIGFLTLFSVGVMSFISMASPVGPWIDVTLMLFALFIVKTLFRHVSYTSQQDMLGYATAAGSIGGSVATACGFAFPTLYFLQPDLFFYLLQNPMQFYAIMSLLILSAGLLGMLIAHSCAPFLLRDSSMAFPIGQMTYSLMNVGNALHKSYELVAGLLSSALFNAAHSFLSIIPKKIVLIRQFAVSLWTVPTLIIRSDWIFMLVAIGFVTGHVVALPLAVGLALKILIADPVHAFFFSDLGSDDFFFAFCTGIILQGTVLSFFELPGFLHSLIKHKKKQLPLISAYERSGLFIAGLCALFIAVTAFFLWYVNFSLSSQLYLILFSSLFTYQIATIGGKTGLAPIGRFATWLMFPFLIIFGGDPLKLTLVATFMEISGMVVVDTLFGRKMAQLARLDTKKMMWYQLFGLVLSALCATGVFWLLITHFGLGISSPLLVQRCQARALLLNASSFNYAVMLCGVIIGFIMRSTKVNSTLALGGLLLPLDFSLLLIAGGMLTYMVKDKQSPIPFWSGVFAASALCMVAKTLM